jgi:hypothetical protein
MVRSVEERDSEADAGARRQPIIAALIIGLMLMLAPVGFQMFSRAPLGGDMIDDFGPYMTTDKVESFRGYLVTVGEANAETIEMKSDVVVAGVATDAEYDTALVAVTQLNDSWQGINADMTDLIDRMERNIGNYEAVAALPTFDLFPWFFLLPGLIIAGLSASILWAQRSGSRPARRLWALVGVGLAVVLAPAVFQMFGRAPQGRDMIDDFRPMMTRERVQDVQGYFVTMGAAEGQMRTQAAALAADAGMGVDDYPAIAEFSADWPAIVVDFNPMVATMSDNVDNFAAVDALPSFALFPWFFVVPGALVAALAGFALRRRPAEAGSATIDRSVLDPQGATQ